VILSSLLKVFNQVPSSELFMTSFFKRRKGSCLNPACRGHFSRKCIISSSLKIFGHKTSRNWDKPLLMEDEIKNKNCGVEIDNKS
jgi:hypothetical protein